MQPACIRHTELPGTSRLFSDFSYNFDRVSRFYRYNPHDPESLKQAAGEVNYPDDRRAALVAALRGQNGDSEALQKLAQAGTKAIVTGQQVGLFGGPAYTIYKALTAARLARDLTASGIPAVPIFWLATEDHDLPEVDHAWMFGTESDPVAIRLNAARLDGEGDPANRPRPVGRIRVVNPPLEELQAALRGFPFADEVIAAVEESYRPGATMGEGFRALLRRLTGGLGLIFLDPLDPAIRKIAAPFMQEALRAAPELKPRLLERSHELNGAGYHAQVHVDAKTSLFFLLEDGARVQLRRKDAEFAELAGRATDVSPNALLRPVMQDYLLPTIAYIGGPGELAYLAQSQVIYDHLLGRMPVAMSRTGFTLVDPRSAKLLDRYSMTTAQTFVHKEALEQRVAHALIPAELDQSFAKAGEEIERRLDRVATDLEAFDHTLAAALAKSRAKIQYQVEKIRKKTARETFRRNQRAAADARHLASMLYPHRHLQERFYSILPFLAQHGPDLVDRLYDAVEVNCPDHRVFLV